MISWKTLKVGLNLRVASEVVGYLNLMKIQGSLHVREVANPAECVLAES